MHELEIKPNVVTFSEILNACNYAKGCFAGSPENISMQETMPQDVEDELTSVVGMLALALEKLKNKVKLLINKKSSEILVPVAEAMQAQFHNLASQIHTDTSKLTSLIASIREND